MQMFGICICMAYADTWHKDRCASLFFIEIRKPAGTDLWYLNKICGKKYVIVYDASYLIEEGQWRRDH